jgi:hypothetical protein
MRTRIAIGLAIGAAGLVTLMSGPVNTAGAQDKSKIAPPKHLYGHDLKVRPGGEREWTKAVKVGVEFFHDDATRSIVAISDVGDISVAQAPVGGAAVGMDKTCQWLTAHDLNCRKAGEAAFTQKTKKWGVELFRDRGTNRLLYACESGAIALAPVPPGLVTEKGPKWHHALEPRVRSTDQIEFTNAKKFGMEIFKDENTGGLIYITETGSIATSAAPATKPEKIAPPKAAYGLSLRVRGAEETDFTEKTKRINLEVFEDPNANTLFYLTESGFIAVAPNPGKLTAGATGVTWKSAMALRARKAGEPDFAKAKKYGIEVFEDNRTGNLIFISETGSVAVLAK